MSDYNHKHFLRNKRIFTESEWETAEGIDRLYIHLMEPHKWPLNMIEAKKLEDLTAAWAIIVKEPRPRNRVFKVAGATGVQDRQAMKLIDDAKELFGEVLEVDIWLERRLAYQRLMGLYRHASEAKDFAAAEKIQKQALELLDKIEKTAPKEAKQYMPIQTTTNPKALTARNAQEIDFEDVPTVPKSEATPVLRGQ